MQIFSYLLMILTVTPQLFAKPILAGKTVLGCEARVLYVNPPAKPAELTNNYPIPDQCTDFSGQWEGGCFRHYTYSSNWPSISGYVALVPLTPMSEVKALPLDGVDLEGEPKTPKFTIYVKQTGCTDINIITPEKEQTIHFAKRFLSQSSEGFARKCRSDKYTWQRTYDMGFSEHEMPLWKNGGTWFRDHYNLRGYDINYGAEFIRTTNVDYTLWKGFLRLDVTMYQLTKNFDPKAFAFDFPSVGSDICVFRRK